MKYTCALLSVADITAARKFYEDLFGLELFQDYGRNISFTCGLALQQDFDWLVHLPKEQIGKKSNQMEICFEEPDFDGFLEKLKKYPDLEFLGDVVEDVYKRQAYRSPSPQKCLPPAPSAESETSKEVLLPEHLPAKSQYQRVPSLLKAPGAR